ncbi:MAG: hypothetical protein CMH55_01795 [Myxococcales bacterium]|nr:hypothetical protein [Myxococcales bacterium]
MTDDEAQQPADHLDETGVGLQPPAQDPRLWRWLLCTPIIALALWRLVDAWQLHFGGPWSYYLSPPNPVLWLLICGAAAAGLKGQIPWGAVKAGFFVFAVFFFWIMPPERGSDAAHPDQFLAYEVDRVSGQIWAARKARNLPQHPLDLRAYLLAPIEFSYRHQDKEQVALRIEIEMNATGPSAKVADRPGVIHVAVETEGEERIWLRATGLGGRRFGPPAFILEPDADGPATILVQHPRGLSRPQAQPPSPVMPPPQTVDAGQTHPLDGGPR